MRKRKIRWSAVPILMVLLGAVFWHHEDAGYVCAKTGSEMGYDEYFSLIRTNRYHQTSWVQRIAEEQFEFRRKDHDWRKIRGTRTSRFSRIHSHETAPAIHSMGRAALDETSYEFALEEFGIVEPSVFVEIMLFGTEDDRKAALQGGIDRMAREIQ